MVSSRIKDILAERINDAAAPSGVIAAEVVNRIIAEYMDSIERLPRPAHGALGFDRGRNGGYA